MRLVIVFLAAVLLMFQSGLAAEASSTDTEIPSPLPAYVDLDGDGIDDNFIDTNSDGIPDKNIHCAQGLSELTTAISSSSGIFSSMPQGSVDVNISLSHLQQFSSLMTRTRCLSMSRGGFGMSSAFGPGNGIGSGAMRGKICVGGVCF